MPLDLFLQDVRYGARSLRRTPSVTLLAIASLALGIMATTAIYSVVHGVVLDPFPYKDVDQLMSVKVWDPSQRGYRLYYTPSQILEIAERNTIFQGVIASTISDVLWTGEGEPQRLRGNYVTTNTFQIMGVPPLLGRAIAPSDGTPSAPPVAVLGYRFWKTQFAGDPHVLGRELRLNDKVRTVIGVMPKRFMWRGADVYLPVTFERGRIVEGVEMAHLLGRLKPGVTDAQAEADLWPIIQELKRKEPTQFPDKWRVGLLPFKETFPSSIRQALWILFGAVGLLLLIACANVSNLLLSKATGRQKEMAVRASLGAARGRLIRQLLTESLMLAVAGGVLGVLLAFVGLKGILALVPPDTIPDEAEVVINIPVLLFTLGVSVVTALVFGLAPALHGSTPDFAGALKQSSRGLSGGARQALLRNGLVVVEVSLSLMLLVGAGLMMRTLMAMEEVDLGIRADRILSMRIPLSAQRFPGAERRVTFFRELLERVGALPGVAAVGLNAGLHPLGAWGARVTVVGSSVDDSKPVMIHQVNTDYLKVFGIPLLQGRLFSVRETLGKQHLALANQAFVRKYLGGKDPLGRLVQIPRMASPPFNIPDNSFQIIGIVRDTLNQSITNEIWPELYVPYTFTGMADYLAVLARGDASSITNAVRSQVYAIDKNQPVTSVRTIARLLNEAVYARPRFNLILFGVFAAMGLLLGVVGVYGVISNSVAQQTKDIGIRIALGASSGAVVAMVMKRALRLLLAGITVGLIGSLATSRILAQQLWKVSPFDMPSFALVSLLIVVSGLQACFWPAWRAARINPVNALRIE